MSFNRTDQARIIELTTENEKIIELFEKILTANNLDTEKDTSIAASVLFGKAQDLDGLLSFGVRVVNNFLLPAHTHVSAKNAGKGRPLQADSVMLDIEERSVYDRYIANCEMELNQYYTNQEHHEELVSDYRILIYILYKRCTMQAFAKNKSMPIGIDKAIWFNVIHEFTLTLKAQKEIKLEKRDHQLIDRFSTRENLSQELISRMADREAAKRTIEASLNYLDELSLNIKRHLLVALSQAVNVEGLSQLIIGIHLTPVLAEREQVDATLLKWENEVVGEIKKDALPADIKSIVALSTSEKQTTWDLVTEKILDQETAYKQNYIIKQTNNDSLKQLYGLLNATHILMIKIGCFSSINQGIGMIPLMLNLLSIEKFDTLLQNHRESVKEIIQQCWRTFKLKGLGNELDSSRLEIDGLMKRKLLSFKKITDKDLLNRIANDCIDQMNTLHRLGKILGCSIIPAALLNRDICIRIGIGSPAHTTQPLAITSSSVLSINMDEQEQERMKGKEKEKEKKENKNKGKEKDKEEGKEKEKVKEERIPSIHIPSSLKKTNTTPVRSPNRTLKVQLIPAKQPVVDLIGTDVNQTEIIRFTYLEKAAKQDLFSALNIDRQTILYALSLSLKDQDADELKTILVNDLIEKYQNQIFPTFSEKMIEDIEISELNVALKNMKTHLNYICDNLKDNITKTNSDSPYLKITDEVKLITQLNQDGKITTASSQNYREYLNLKKTYENRLRAVSRRLEILQAYLESEYVKPSHPSFSIPFIEYLLASQHLAIHLWKESDIGTLEKINPQVDPAAKQHLLCFTEDDRISQFIPLSLVEHSLKQDKTVFKESLLLNLTSPMLNNRDKLAILSYFLVTDQDVAEIGLTTALEQASKGELLTFTNRCIKEGFHYIYAQLKTHYENEQQQIFFDPSVKRELKINISSFFNNFLNKKMLDLFQQEQQKHDKGYFVLDAAKGKQFFVLLTASKSKVIFDHVRLIEVKANRFVARHPQKGWIFFDTMLAAQADDILADLKQCYGLDDQTLASDPSVKEYLTHLNHLDERIAEFKQQDIPNKEELLAMYVTERIFLVKTLYQHYATQQGQSLYFHTIHTTAGEQTTLLLDPSIDFDQANHHAMHFYIDENGYAHQVTLYENTSTAEWQDYIAYLLDQIERLFITDTSSILTIHQYLSAIMESTTLQFKSLGTDKKDQLQALKKVREEKWQIIQKHSHLKEHFDAFADMAISVNEELNQFKQTPLFLAITQHNNAMIRYLLRHGASVTATCYMPYDIVIDTTIEKITFSKMIPTYVLNFDIDQTGKRGCLIYEEPLYPARKVNIKNNIIGLQEKIDAISDPKKMSVEQLADIENMIIDYHQKIHAMSPLSLFLQQMTMENEEMVRLFYSMVNCGIQEAKPRDTEIQSFDLLKTLSHTQLIPPLINHFSESLQKEKDDLDSFVSNMLHALINLSENDMKRATAFVAYIHALVKGETSHNYLQLLQDCDEVIRQQTVSDQSDAFHQTVKTICEEARKYIDSNGGLSKLEYQYQAYLKTQQQITVVAHNPLSIQPEKLVKMVAEQRADIDRLHKEYKEALAAERLEKESQLQAERLEKESQLQAERLEKEKKLKEKDEQHESALKTERLKKKKLKDKDKKIENKLQEERLERKRLEESNKKYQETLEEKRLEGERKLKEKDMHYQQALEVKRLEKEKEHEEWKQKQIQLEKEKEEHLQALSVALAEIRKMQAAQSSKKEVAANSTTSTTPQPSSFVAPLTLFSAAGSTVAEKLTARLCMHLTNGDYTLQALPGVQTLFAAVAVSLLHCSALQRTWDQAQLLEAVQHSGIEIEQIPPAHLFTVAGPYLCKIIGLDAIYHLTLNDDKISCEKAAKDTCHPCAVSEIEKQIGQAPIIIQDSNAVHYVLRTNRNVLTITPTMSYSHDKTHNG